MAYDERGRPRLARGSSSGVDLGRLLWLLSRMGLLWTVSPAPGVPGGQREVRTRATS
jgi:hypothetical protein